MVNYPVDVRRCQHIKSNGTQCGSPGLREDKFCYFHQECRPERVEIKGADGKTSQILVPVFEDGSSIQMMVRRVAVLILQDKIDSKKAGQVLYALQIASSNLGRLEEEKPRPTQMVVDREKVAETPLGKTPWSARGEEHDPEALCVEIEEAEKLVEETNEGWVEAFRKTKDWFKREASDIQSWRTDNPCAGRGELDDWLTAVINCMVEESDRMEKWLEERAREG